MRLVRALPDAGMLVQGYEHHSFECKGCGEHEDRLIFLGAGGDSPSAAASDLPPPTASEPSAAGHRAEDAVVAHPPVAHSPAEVSAAELPAAPAPTSESKTDAVARDVAPPRPHTTTTVAPRPVPAAPAARLTAAAAPDVAGSTASSRPATAWDRAMERVRAHQREIERRWGPSRRPAPASAAAAPTLPRAESVCIAESGRAENKHTEIKHTESKPAEIKLAALKRAEPALCSSSITPVIAPRAVRPIATLATPAAPVRAPALRRRVRPEASRPALSSEQDAEAKRRFAEFWDRLALEDTPAPPVAAIAPVALPPAIKPLPRSRSLVMANAGGPVILWAPATAARQAKPVQPKPVQFTPAQPKPVQPKAVRKKLALQRFTADALLWGVRD